MFSRSAINSYRAATCAMFLINGFTFGSWSSRIPSIKEAIGLSPSLLGWALLCMGCGALLSMSLIGPAITRMGSRKLTAWSCLLTVLAFGCVSFANSFLSLMLLLLTFGMLSGTMDVSMNTNAVSVEKAAGKPIMSSFHAAWSIGAMAGAAIGGLLASMHWSVLQHFWYVSLVMGILALSFVSALIEDPPTENGAANEAGNAAGERAGAEVVPISLLALSVACFCSFISEGAIADWAALFLMETVGADQGFAALGFAAFSLTMAAGRLFGDRIIARYTDAVALLMGGIFSSVGAALVVAYPHQYLSLAGFACAGLGLSVQVPICFRLAGHSGEKPSGEAIAVVARAGYFGLLAGPSLFGYAAEWFGMRASLSMVAMFGLCTVILALKMTRPKRRTIG